MPNDQRLLGTWLPDSSTPRGDLVSIEFREDGSLLYTIDFNGEEHTLVLLYETAGGVLTTRDEFAGVLASSSYKLDPDGALELAFHGAMFIYRRSDPQI